MPELKLENIHKHIKPLISKTDLNNIYFGICKIANSFDRLKSRLVSKPLNPKIKKISNDLNTCKQLIKQMYLRFRILPPSYNIYIEANSSGEFIEKLSFAINETIFRCAAICNCDNVKKFTDFSLIIMVLADLNKNLALSSQD